MRGALFLVGTTDVILLSLLAFVILNLLLAVPLLFLTAWIIFQRTMVRERREMWGRDCSDPDPEQQAMYNEGVRFMEPYADRKTELHMVNDGLNLYAEYYDFGFDRAVIVVPGRTEGLRYGYYFAEPYVKHGYNLLTIDQRCHGESDGRYNSIGFAEHHDLLLWAKRLHEEFGMRSILLHGICIGSACSMYALTSENAPDYFEGLVAEGMYASFYESFKNHVIERKKPVFIMGFVDFWMKHYTGYSMKVGPIDRIGVYRKPLLMLHGTADSYSVPEKATVLYETAGTPDEDKRIVWFEGGRHSRLRITDKEKYDGAIEAFLGEVIDRRRASEHEAEALHTDMMK